MDTVKHTQGKWTSADFKDYGAVLYLNGNRIADIKEGKHAEFIVRACNSHAELLRLCKEALGYANQDFYIRLINVIAKAEGK